jgi:malonyl-CoA/methylmalonyl-CoA synthetase
MTGMSTEKLGQSVTRSMSDQDGISIPCIPSIAFFFEAALVPPRDIIISSDRMLDVNSACFVVFTSGTTGPPKGVVQRRSYLITYVVADVSHYSITDQDTVLHVVPVHQATGVGPTLLPFLSAGACVEFRSGGFDTAWTWERWRQGGITFFSGVPTMYMRLMRYFEEDIMTRQPPEAREQYVAGVRAIRILMCGTSALPGPVQDFWSRLRGKPIQTRYGATEFGVIIKTDPDSGDAPKNSVGRPVAGVTLKISDEGQLMVKSPFMFSK